MFRIVPDTLFSREESIVLFVFPAALRDILPSSRFTDSNIRAKYIVFTEIRVYCGQLFLGGFFLGFNWFYSASQVTVG